MIKKFGTRLLSAAVVGSLVVMPVSAAPGVDDLKGKKAAAQSEVDSLQEQLTEIIEKIDDLERELIKTGEDITAATEDLKKAEELEKEQYEAMKLRIRYMYEQGNTSALEALFSAADFSELVNKADYVQKVHKYDRDKLEEYVETKKKIKKLKTRLEKDQEKIVASQAEFESEENNLNTLVEEKQGEVADLDGQIQAAVEEAARKAAEEEEKKQKEAEEKAKQQESGKTQTNNTPSKDDNNDSDKKEEGGSKGESNSGPGYDSAVGGSVVSRAYGKLGVPYVYGACSPNAFDCSGFVSYCLTGRYERIGTSGTFAGWPRVSNPQPGDIVVRPGHVGIYIGGGQMIHAPHTGDVVKIASVPSSMWYVRCPW